MDRIEKGESGSMYVVIVCEMQNFVTTILNYSVRHDIHEVPVMLLHVVPTAGSILSFFPIY